jgi:hypothetical protein
MSGARSFRTESNSEDSISETLPVSFVVAGGLRRLLYPIGRIAINCAPTSWKSFCESSLPKATLIGRLTRPAPDKPTPVVHDYLDNKVPVLSAMFQRRLKVFRRAIGAP